VQTFAILANLPLVPLAGVLTQAGVAALGVLVFWPALTPWVFAPFTLLLTWTVSIAATVAAWRPAQLYIAAPSVPMVVGYYGSWGFARLAPLASASAVCRVMHCVDCGRCQLAISGTRTPHSGDVFGCWGRRRDFCAGAWESCAPHRWWRHV